MATAYRLRTSYAATATALLLGMPPVGEFSSSALTPAQNYKYESFAEAGKAVSDAFARKVYGHPTPEAMFSLITEVATRLIEESQPLNREYAKVVEREFWNLLQ